MINYIPAAAQFFTQEIYKKSTDEQAQLKEGYIDALCKGIRYDANYVDYLSHQTVENLQQVYLATRNLFTDQCEGQDRLKIIDILLQIPRSYWDSFLKQICFVMPVGTRGHDVAWAAEVLRRVKKDYRDLFVQTTMLLCDPYTLTVERGYIMQALADHPADLETLCKYIQDSENKRKAFFQQHVEKSLLPSAGVISVTDPILKNSWGKNKVVIKV